MSGSLNHGKYNLISTREAHDGLDLLQRYKKLIELSAIILSPVTRNLNEEARRLEVNEHRPIFQSVKSIKNSSFDPRSCWCV